MERSRAITKGNVSADELTPLRHGRGESRRIVRSESFDSDLTANLVTVKSGSEPGPYHYHAGAATFYLVLQGQVRFIVDGDVIDASAQEGCFMEAGVPHATHNVSGDEDATILLVFDHPTEGDFVEVPLPDPDVYSQPWKAN
ncbi:MAG: cupin domain-containing protein [Acidimicrobiia bacterium]|nr:cupin domain-containing protein [Acidimicrobiia bacterium]MDH3463889.1 cupin domain-containing protein [Acidimicrobiia bacterium]